MLPIIARTTGSLTRNLMTKWASLAEIGAVLVLICDRGRFSRVRATPMMNEMIKPRYQHDIYVSKLNLAVPCVFLIINFFNSPFEWTATEPGRPGVGAMVALWCLSTPAWEVQCHIPNGLLEYVFIINTNIPFWTLLQMMCNYLKRGFYFNTIKRLWQFTDHAHQLPGKFHPWVRLSWMQRVKVIALNNVYHGLFKQLCWGSVLQLPFKCIMKGAKPNLKLATMTTSFSICSSLARFRIVL
jgi:hypothetical protein